MHSPSYTLSSTAKNNCPKHNSLLLWAGQLFVKIKLQKTGEMKWYFRFRNPSLQPSKMITRQFPPSCCLLHLLSTPLRMPRKSKLSAKRWITLLLLPSIMAGRLAAADVLANFSSPSSWKIMARCLVAADIFGQSCFSFPVTALRTERRNVITR